MISYERKRYHNIAQQEHGRNLIIETPVSAIVLLGPALGTEAGYPAPTHISVARLASARVLLGPAFGAKAVRQARTHMFVACPAQGALLVWCMMCITVRDSEDAHPRLSMRLTHATCNNDKLSAAVQAHPVSCGSLRPHWR